MYDNRCLDLAEYFLGNKDQNRARRLAQLIQDTVDDFIELLDDKADDTD